MAKPISHVTIRTISIRTEAQEQEVRDHDRANRR